MIGSLPPQPKVGDKASAGSGPGISPHNNYFACTSQGAEGSNTLKSGHTGRGRTGLVV
jgi:hypothetical protein